MKKINKSSFGGDMKDMADIDTIHGIGDGSEKEMLMRFRNDDACVIQAMMLHLPPSLA